MALRPDSAQDEHDEVIAEHMKQECCCSVDCDNVETRA